MSRSTQAELSRAERAAAPVPPADATTRGPLFAPHRVAGLELPNGFAMAPMTRQQAPAGTPDATVVEYYRRRAAGGVGLIVTEGILLDHPTAGDHPDLPRLSGRAERARLLTEIVAAIRQVVGPRFVVGVRFSQFKERAFTARIAETPGELATLLEPVASAGADLLHASTRRVWEPAFDGSTRTLAGWAKMITGLPVIGVGSVGLRAEDLFGSGSASLARLSRLRDRGEFDLLALGRALLANPDMVDQLAAGESAGIVDYRKQQELIFP